MLIFRENPVKLSNFASPISRGATTILPLQIVLSRKIFKKVTNKIFPPLMPPKPAPLLQNSNLFPAVNN
jgi:hypothetical protein